MVAQSSRLCIIDPKLKHQITKKDRSRPIPRRTVTFETQDFIVQRQIVK
jgi:hypothetical protein